ncbi:protein of unknown function [Candidatus Promineifilum breve]|uniref:Uncharacterized protein n=1 Tax=Candidatus Promineifilum breve TaxID=1806508 RepID=A0A160T4U0_9CHLR|nr:protein of unknown function [Candidatus Promineifilum breve]
MDLGKIHKIPLANCQYIHYTII